MPRTPKMTTIIVTAELSLETELIYDKDTLSKDLLGEWIKVKSGLYENLAAGCISSVKVV